MQSTEGKGQRDIVVQIKFGSHLYGTNTPTSDEDFKSVYVPSGRDILLQRVVGSLQLGQKDKREGEKNLPGDVDNECYALQRYLSLIAEGQTVAVDMLFAPEPMFATDLWRFIQENRERLLTKRSAAFVGYCRTQANKYGIKGSRVASAKNALDRFEALLAQHGTLAKVGEFFTADDEVIDEHTRTLRKETTQGRVERYFECCNRMVGFNNTVKEAVGIFRRIYENYGDRARLAEKNEGIDWKALSHAVRVGREAIELLTAHHITFPLADAAHILAIKRGKLPYDTVASEIETLLEQVERAAEESTLRDAPDYGFIDELVAREYGSQVAEAYSQSGAGPTEEAFVLELAAIYGLDEHFMRALPEANLHQWKELVKVQARGHENTRKIMEQFRAELIELKFGAGSPEETGTCLVCPCGKAYRIIGGEIVELSKEQAEVMQEEADSSSQSAKPPSHLVIYCPACQTQHIDEGEWATRLHKTHQCQKCKLEWRPFPYATFGVAGGGSTGERAEPSEREKFEIWVKGSEFGYELTRSMIRGERTGEYIKNTTYNAWQGWQARAALAEGSRTRHCAICAENRPATCDGRCELVAPRKGDQGETNG